jgi:DnaJ-domain-containing protein 1
MIIYLLNPFDLISDLIPVWGWLDDGVLLFLLWNFIYKPWIQQKQRERFYRQNQEQFHRNHQYGPNESEPDKEERPKDPYTILGVARNATPEEIKTAYKQLANKYHPDKLQHLGEEFRKLAEKRFKEIQEAYQKLK